jgi:predicted Zn-dependent peptidase
MRIHQTTLANGLRVVHEEMPWLPSLSFEVLVPMGAMADPEGFEGSSFVLSDWITRGAAERDSKVLSDALDSLGVRHGESTSVESIGLSASLLADTLGECLDIFADIIQRPLLPDNEFEPARQLALQELASVADNPARQLFTQLAKDYFASTHGRSSYGSEAGLKALSPEVVRDDYRRRFSPRGAIFSSAGGLSWEEVLSLVEHHLATWQGEDLMMTPVVVNPRSQRHQDSDTAQTQIGVAYPGVAPGQQGWYEHALATNVLSGGMGARLFSEVREKRGLVYSVAAFNRAVRDYGYTMSYAGTTPERADETLDVLLTELTRIREGVTSAELERARTGILSQLVMQGESSRARASSLAQDCFLLDRPRPIEEIKEAIQAVTLEGLNHHLAKRPEPEFTILTLGPKALMAAESA